MMDRASQVVIIAFLIGITLSFSVARRSERVEKIYGGLSARIFHHLAIIGYVSVLPAAFFGSLLVGPFKFGIPFAFVCLFVSFLCFGLYGLVERPARIGVIIEDRGWTEEDARTSGL
ncbi:MAG: hypothetical protein R3E39_03885 [Anaerolineae bacterium]